MVELNLPPCKFNIIEGAKGNQVFDGIRRKYVLLTPEEWVRQHFIHYLSSEKQMPKNLMKLEMKLRVNQMDRRPDIVIFNQRGTPALIVECKAPEINITQDAFEQIAQYNLVLKVPYLAVTNGLNHYYCHMDIENRSYEFIRELPHYAKL